MVFPVTVALADRLAWMPFCAIAVVGPTPWTTLLVTVPVEVAPSTTMPLF